jgi:hypothetical protein
LVSGPVSECQLAFWWCQALGNQTFPTERYGYKPSLLPKGKHWGHSDFPLLQPLYLCMGGWGVTHDPTPPTHHVVVFKHSREVLPLFSVWRVHCEDCWEGRIKIRESVCALSSPGCLGHGVELSPAPMARAHPAAHVKWDSATYCMYGDRVPSSI